MRLFFAAFPDGETRQRIAAAARALEFKESPAFLPPEKYHMTLVFLGRVADGVVPGVREIGERQRGACIALRFDRWEYWAGARAVVASSPDRPDSLTHLRASLAADLMRRGVAFDDKPLRPHMTVARKLTQAPVLPQMSSIDCALRSFSLVSSVTSPRGSIYTVVGSWPLLDTAARS